MALQTVLLRMCLERPAAAARGLIATGTLQATDLVGLTTEALQVEVIRGALDALQAADEGASAS